MSNELKISLENASVHFKVNMNGGSLKSRIIGALQRDNNVKYVKALDNINLSIGQGERVGVIGLNGAGKSTLLKLMAGIYPPTSGKVNVIGHVCPMFEFATGFEMHQTGWDNIRIRALLLGMQPDEVEEKIHKIAEFTELGEFLNYPVRTYSAGMFIRLAFAVSTSINPEILLLDEVVGAGDMNFAAKAKDRMFEFMQNGKILVFTSHSMALIREYCDRVIWVKSGSIILDGNANFVINEYEQNANRMSS
ncbi:ABC transporter ATP-binding protein [Aeromonas veronii]|uniref:ABC transporter ATP-binding protein n=1 Tax=Aeromonas veronii TaxID=654 RepID=UPI003BA0EDEB